MRRLNKKGQSTVEYIPIWTCIVAALVAVTVNGNFRASIEDALGTMGTKVEDEVDFFSSELNSYSP